MKECWNSDHLKRPKASDIRFIINKWYLYIKNYHINYSKTYVDIKNIKGI